MPINTADTRKNQKRIRKWKVSEEMCVRDAALTFHAKKRRPITQPANGIHVEKTRYLFFVAPSSERKSCESSLEKKKDYHYTEKTWIEKTCGLISSRGVFTVTGGGGGGGRKPVARETKAKHCRHFLPLSSACLFFFNSSTRFFFCHTSIKNSSSWQVDNLMRVR